MMKFQFLNPIRWNRTSLFTILAAFTAVWFLFIDTYSLYTRYELNQRRAELEKRTDELREETAILEVKLENLEENADLLEKIAREEYGMRKPGETVYKIEKQ